MTLSRLLTAAAMAALASTLATAQGNPYAGITTVEVFANSAMAITPTRADVFKLTIHRMDAMEFVRQSINQQIPRGGEAPARAWLAANQDHIKRQVRPAAIAAANAANMARYYKLDRLPAIVINRNVVVYGMTDVNAAIARYRGSRGGRR